MKKIAAMLLLAILITPQLFCDYSSDIINGKIAMGQNDYLEAIKYYSSAEREKPSEALEKYIEKLKQVSGYTTDESMTAAPVTHQDNPWKWVLIGSDIAFTVWGFYAYNDMENEDKKYAQMESDWWNYGSVSFDDLTRENETEMEKDAIGVTVVSVAGGLLLYTIIVALSLHFVFPENVKTSYNPAKNELKLTYNYKY